MKWKGVIQNLYQTIIQRFLLFKVNVNPNSDYSEEQKWGKIINKRNKNVDLKSVWRKQIY